MNLGGSLDLQVDPAEAERRKRARLVQLNTLVVPRLRVLGFAGVAAAALLHNAFVYPGAGAFTWGPWLKLVASLIIYNGATWYLLYLFYEDARAHVDLGTVLLACDMWMFSVCVYFTGAEHSWMFFLPLFRVVDQTGTSFRRALAFAHLAPLSYAAVVIEVLLRQHRAIPLAPEIAKVLLIYIGSLYIALIARTADARRARSSEIIRLARALIRELADKSTALERSSRQLHDALDQQADLHKENARLFSATEAREARLSQILHSTSDGIIFVAPDGRIEAANLRAGDLLGFDPQTVIGMDVMRILARLYSLGDSDSFGTTLKTLLSEPGPGGHGDLQQPATGRVFNWVAQATRDSTGGTVGLTFTFQDVTPTRDLVRQLEDKSRLLDEARQKAEEANRARGEFLANVTHEVRTPLSAIIDMTAQIREADVARRIKTAAEALLAIIGDILDFSKIDSRKLTLASHPLELRVVLQGVIDTVKNTAAEKGLRLVLDVAPEVPDQLIGDALRLRQILANLIGNAIKFTQTGEVRVRVNVASALPGEVCLHFAVIDTGIGIPRDKQELVFEAFAQADGTPARRFGGTGLGLSISARLVELMGGDIWVESEVGRGSAFRFTANFALERAARVRAPANPDDSVRAVNVLLAEDEPELAGREAFLEGLGNDAKLARRLIDLFMDDSTKLVGDIRRAIAARDADRLRRAAHTLKGSVSNFPAGTARETAARMEAIGLDGNFEAAEETFPTLEKEIDRLRSVLPTLV